MTERPLDRDEQIKFMKEARARRQAAVERWSNSDMIRAALREPARGEGHDPSYTRKDVRMRNCA